MPSDRDRGVREQFRRRSLPPFTGAPGRSLEDRVSAEPGRPRRARATYELAHAGGTTRYDAERLPAPRRERFGVAATGAALGFWQAAVGGVHPAPVWRTGAALPHALLLASARVGRFRKGVTMECAGLLGDGLTRSRRLDGAVDHPGLERG